MKRTIATLGVVGLGLMAATVAANAAPPDKADDKADNDKKITICRATSSASNPWEPISISVKALGGQVNPLDIVPANSGDDLPLGQNLTAANIAILAHGCSIPPVVVEPPAPPVVVVEPVVEQPVNEVVVPPAAPPAVVPPAAAPPAAAPKAAAPVAAAPRAAAPAAVPAASNPGYNVQTAVGDMPGTGIPAWLAVLTGLFTGVGALVLAKGGLRSRSANG